MPYQTFEAADGALVIAIGNDAQWVRLCQALELPELAARHGTNPERVRHRSDVVGAIGARLASGPRAHWLERLRAAAVPAGPVREVHEAVRDPALAARGMVSAASVGDTEVPLFALPWRIDGARPPLRHPPPALGAQTGAFMQRWGEPRGG